MSFRSSSLIAGIALLLPLVAQAFSIQPALLDVSASAGQPTVSQFNVTNTTNQPQTFYLSSMAFEPQADSGSPAFDASDKSGTANWLTFSSPTISVAPLYQGKVSISVLPPIGTPPGEYYVAALVSTTPSVVVSAINGAAIEANIAELIFVTVGGNGQVKLGLLDFAVQNSGGVRGGLWGTYQYRLQNQGTVHVVPQGTVSIKDVFGNTIASGPANGDGERVLPDNTRTFTGNLAAPVPQNFIQAVVTEAQNFALGPVTVHLNLTPGLTPNAPLQADVRLWIFPWQLLLVVVLAVGALYGLMKLLMRSRVK